jgi:hypothetical protein
MSRGLFPPNPAPTKRGEAQDQIAELVASVVAGEAVAHRQAGATT